MNPFPFLKQHPNRVVSATSILLSSRRRMSSISWWKNSLPDTMANAEFPGRKTASPIALGDHEALERYMSTTRSNAVYLPSNIDYGARNNGLEGGATEVFEKLMGSNWVIRAIVPDFVFANESSCSQAAKGLSFRLRLWPGRRRNCWASRSNIPCRLPQEDTSSLEGLCQPGKRGA